MVLKTPTTHKQIRAVAYNKLDQAQSKLSSIESSISSSDKLYKPIREIWELLTAARGLLYLTVDLSRPAEVSPEEQLMRKAHSAVYAAIAKKKLVRPKICGDCGLPCRPQAHHRDYLKPLDVVWLCRMCHKKEHKKINSEMCQVA